jgi:hypothetical protein
MKAKSRQSQSEVKELMFCSSQRDDKKTEESLSSKRLLLAVKIIVVLMNVRVFAKGCDKGR